MTEGNETQRKLKLLLWSPLCEDEVINQSLGFTLGELTLLLRS